MEGFGEFCCDVFATLRRVDQRHAAETYLYGLLNCTGRKSIRRLAAAAPGRSEQSLQQFINQSPWDPEPVRQRLMMHLVRSLRPTAWAIEEIAFLKNGRYSAAVDRQYVRSLGRVRNCQLAISVVLVAGQTTVPVNWRLLVPEVWGRDKERRARARMPDHELPRPYWQYHLEVLDDMALEWGMPAAPTLVDTRQRGSVDAFLGALELRRQSYLARVSPSLTVGYGKPQPRPTRGGVGSVNGSGPSSRSWWGTASELITKAENLSRETVEWHSHENGGVLRSQFVRVPVHLQGTDDGEGRSPRLLVAEWPLSKPRPRGFWVTNIVDVPLAELVTLAKQQELIGPRIEDFAGRYGLRDYEGRTFAGWHHHVTLASAAGTFHVLKRLQRAAAGSSVESGSD
jgi:SRSO17 transposase